MKTNEFLPPDILYGELFEMVQLQRVFPDSKTFVDCIAKFNPETILRFYHKEKKSEVFDLKRFILRNFNLPDINSSDFKSDPQKTAKEHVESLWPILTRKADEPEDGSTLISLPQPYIVPGGRFGEIYYWDSYFTMLGLEVSGKIDLIEYMLNNFAYLIDEFGFVPNGNRSYYLTRSQPPYFALMVQLLRAKKGESVLVKYYPQLLKEYQFWMRSNEHKASGEVSKNVENRIVLLKGKTILNRYWDEAQTPRQESFVEDFELWRDQFRLNSSKAEKEADPALLYRNIRAACESGWDFSSRWLRDGSNLSTIETTSLLPVDLNCLLYYLEKTLSSACEVQGDQDGAVDFAELARKRASAIITTCWDSEEDVFQDYNFYSNQFTDRFSLAMVYPLFFNIASFEQANSVALFLKKEFLTEGGLRTTNLNTGQQWDAPNGWPPLQWMSVIGLHNYGFVDLARDIARRWTMLCETVYNKSGKFVEKYNVENITLDAGGGEYPVQDGFGWSNGVYLKLKDLLDRKLL